ncbi:ATP-binding cassette domain-containing protein [Oenococcus sicerae]|uniref:ATP-binding cassette domain-containing protein n=1 Tax=Oenococcus sicerae TaxID=2203724 RepID=UPI0039ED03BC
MKLVLNNLGKSYNNKRILDHFNLTVQPGEFIGIVGKSGSGKSTILNILGLFDNYDQGSYLIDDKRVPKINSSAATKMIRQKINYLSQNFALANNLTVQQNLLLALKYAKLTKQNQQLQIDQALMRVGLSGRNKEIVATLSGGEQQRLAIARTMLKPGELILADEPTAALDKDNRNLVFDLLMQLNANRKTIIMVTHDLELAKRIPRAIEIG